MSNIKKVYAREVPAEVFDWEVYFSEEDAIDMHFWAGGNKDFSDLNKDMISDLRNSIDNVWTDHEYLTLAYHKPSELAAEFDSTIDANFKKASGAAFTNAERACIMSLVLSFYDKNEDVSILCDLLGIVYGEPFKHGILRGSSQGDWLDYICPASVTSDQIRYIEAVLFGTGTEFAILDTPTERDLTADDFDNEDFFVDFTPEHTEAGIKTWIANMFTGISPANVVIFPA